MELNYELMKLAMEGRGFFAPLSDPKRMLDIGTGTGSWPIEMGKNSHIWQEIGTVITDTDKCRRHEAEIFPNCEVGGLSRHMIILLPQEAG